MPIFTINTNLSPDKVPAGFLSKAADLIADILTKPRQYVAVHINTNQLIHFDMNEEPAALCDLVSIGSLGPDLNKKHSNAIMQLLFSELNIPPTRAYITFKNVDRNDAGYMSTTMVDFMG